MTQEHPTAISLFSGIAGIDLGFQQAGFEIVHQVEINDFCQKVLTKNYPNVPKSRDVRDVGVHNLPKADCVIGGFPCTDISIAGKQKGLKGEHSGLWFEFARIIGEIRPRVVFVENVPPIIELGGSTVIANLTQMGYNAEWGVVSASAFGAPHARERWYCIAQLDDSNSNRDAIWEESNWNETKRSSEGVGEQSSEEFTKPRVGIAIDGISGWLDGYRWPSRINQLQFDWEKPRAVAKGEIKNRDQKVKAIGNAVVVPVIYAFAKVIYEILCS